MHITYDHPSQLNQTTGYRAQLKAGGYLCAKHQTMQRTGSSSSDFIIQDGAFQGQDRHNRNHNVFEGRVDARILYVSQKSDNVRNTDDTLNYEAL